MILQYRHVFAWRITKTGLVYENSFTKHVILPVAQAGVSVWFEPHRHHYAKARQGDSQHWLCLVLCLPVHLSIDIPCTEFIRPLGQMTLLAVVPPRAAIPSASPLLAPPVGPPMQQTSNSKFGSDLVVRTATTLR